MRRWEDLAGDVLQKIEELLILYSDKVRICCVCKSWRSVLPELPNNYQLEAQLPWLLVPISCDKSGQASHGLFNLQDKKTYYLDLHNLKLPLVIGSSHGWLVCHANRSVYIINPITEAQVQLPPTYHSIRKIILSSSPSLSDNYLAVAMCHYRCLLAYCKQGDDKWTAIGDEDSYEDIIFHEGQLYALTCEGKLMVIEIAASPRVTILTRPCPELISYNHKIYLLESSTGILMVGRMRKFVTTTYEYEYSGRFRKVRTLEQMVTYRYNVFKFDVSCSQWNKVSHIGDDMLFLSHNFSLSTSCRNLHGLKGNSICFIEDSSKDGYHIAVIDMESKSIQNLPACKCNGDCPSDCPIWLTPTF